MQDFRDIPLGHRVALLGAVLVVLGAYGPWAVGTRIHHPPMGEEESFPYVRTGAEEGGWLLAAPAALAVALLVAPLPAAARRWGALALLGLTLAVACLAAYDPVDFPGIGVHVFQRFDVHLGWGLVLALAGSVVALAGAVAEAVRGWAPARAAA